MAYSIYGPISCRQEIELGVLGLLVIRPCCSVYWAACPAYAGTNLSSGRNYWGKYGPFVLFSTRVNKSAAFIFLVTYLLQHACIMEISAVLTIRSLFIVLVPNRDFFGKLGKIGPYLVPPILTKSLIFSCLLYFNLCPKSLVLRLKVLFHSKISPAALSTSQ